MPHQGRGNAVKVAAVGHRQRGFATQTQKRFIDERRRLQGMFAPFVAHIACGEPMQFAIHQRREFDECIAISGLPLGEQTAQFFFANVLIC